MGYLVIVSVVKALVDAAKNIFNLSDQRIIKALVFVLTTAFVFAYKLNLLAELNMASAYLPFDYAVSVIALSLSAMGVHDLLELIAGRQ